MHFEDGVNCLNIGFDGYKEFVEDETLHEDNPSNKMVAKYDGKITRVELVIGGIGMWLPTEYINQKRVDEVLQSEVDEQIEELYEEK